jgi:amino acid transporter
MMNSIQNKLSHLGRTKTAGRVEGGRKFGTFGGVFVPTIVTILGVIMYLRLAWVVGNAGLLGAILIVLLAHVVTISTGLAVSSIATNIRVGAGGAFSIISQSLGLEVGGSIGITLYLAQGISIALYILGFTDGIVSIFPQAPPIAVAFASFAGVFVIAFFSARFASRVQMIILAIVGLALFSVFMGSFLHNGQPGAVYTPQLIGGFSDGDFWSTFAVFFPAVTGIMVGISLSGNLKEPRKNIPIGTMSAIVITMLIYLALVFWFSQVATTEELLDTSIGNIVMADKARWRWMVLAGLLGGTFSAALGSMVAAPRVMQALGEHRVLPRGNRLAQVTSNGEPRYALLLTGGIALLALGFALFGGGLNAVAPLITMFFLLTYAMLNAVVLIEQTLSMVTFRPTFAIPRLVPFVGLVSCFFVMFLIAPIFSVVAVILTLAMYAYLVRKQLTAPWDDVRSGLFLSLAEWASERVARMPEAPERTWSPNILAPVTSSKTLTGSYRFLRAIAHPQGSVHCLGLYREGHKEPVQEMESLARAFLDDGIYGRSTLLESEDYLAGLKASIEVLSSVFFRPNILFLPLFENEHGYDLQSVLDHASQHRMGLILLARNRVVELGREQIINVWVREQGPDWKLGLRLSNLDLSVLLAYQLSRNWKGQINLCMAVQDDDTATQAGRFLGKLVTLARLPTETEVQILQADFWDALSEIPSADINFFGLADHYDQQFVAKVFETVDASCLFVRDSGDESALA